MCINVILHIETNLSFLFSEFVCPNLGFGEFLSLDFLKSILSWQKEDGCFGKMPKISNPTYANIPKFQKIKKELDSDYDYDEDAKADIEQLQQRVKNVVKMDEGRGQKKISDNTLDLKQAQPNSKKEVFGNNVHLHSHDSNQPMKYAQENPLNVGQSDDGSRKLPGIGGDNRHLLAHQDSYGVKNGPRRKLLVEKEMSGEEFR